MLRKIIRLSVLFLAITTCVLGVFPSEANELNTATGFRTSENSGSSRFVIDFTKKPEYLVSIRKNPMRLVIEIKNASRGNLKDTEKTNLNIKSVRYNRLSNNKLQIVLDLKNQIALPKPFILPPKNNLYRLVVDINPVSNPPTKKKAQEANKNIKSKEAEPTKNHSLSFDDEDINSKTTTSNVAAPPKNLEKEKEIIPIPKLKEVKKTIIAIDAGHGGNDPGTTGYHGSKEKNITIAYAFAIKQALEDTGHYNVILTRKDDTYIDLKKRVEISRDAKADMFLSIHADSHNNHQMSGLSVYTLSEKASDKEAEALAQKENNAGVLNDVDVAGDTKDVTELLIDLVQRETKNLSAEFAENIIKEVRPEAEVLHNKPHRFAGFKVLTGPDIPSALIELGYLSNRKEEKLLLSENHKKKLATAIVKAIDKHFRKYPVE